MSEYPSTEGFTGGGTIMAIGERINFFRRRNNLTMNALGQLNSRKPKADLTQSMADVFGVAPEALAVPDIDTYNLNFLNI